MTDKLTKDEVSGATAAPAASTTLSADTVSDDLMHPEVNVQRIMWTGTIWFGVIVGAIALTLGPLLSSGWRPDQLPPVLEAIWWIGAAVMTLSVGLVGWSGCPILEDSVRVADHNKSRTMQFGTALFIGSGAITLAAVLLG
ncbi:hypothetical protein [Schumannella sp. 10F1B-5-1]|uniref:hypothetical protein n=1 Tax=Schumannella sp. 10F1B-5-1 TaxID=2590780 RepID=UPI0011325956|nr:hypothetical protein [Schumannella sp. 10F1B-5-1]TPW78315.1 hypothetical protein FJ658_00460 [Schumannella sp. 10F1B-5-1]